MDKTEILNFMQLNAFPDYMVEEYETFSRLPLQRDSIISIYRALTKKKTPNHKILELFNYTDKLCTTIDALYELQLKDSFYN